MSTESGRSPSPPAFSLRAARQGEYEQLFALHRAAMGGYIEATFGPWNEEQQRGFFDARMSNGRLAVVEVAGEIAGLWEPENRPGALFVANIEFLPAYQGRGIGTAILRGMMADASSRDLPVELTVLRVNPARKLYERLGFVEYDINDTHHFMRWRAPAH